MEKLKIELDGKLYELEVTEEYKRLVREAGSRLVPDYAEVVRYVELNGTIVEQTKREKD